MRTKPRADSHVTSVQGRPFLLERVQWASVVAAIGLAAITLGAQQAVFRSSVHYVSVDVVVTDKAGHLVRNLRPDDLEVIESGERQSIVSLVPKGELRDSQAVQRALPMSDGMSSVASNADDQIGETFLVVLDSLHIPPEDSPLLRKKAAAFVTDYLRPMDRAAIVHIGGTGRGQEFTFDRRLMIGAINTFIGEKVPSPTVARSGGRSDLQRQIRDSNIGQSVYQLAQICKTFGVVPAQRKTVVFFSEGPDLALGPMSPAFKDLQQIVALSAQENLVIHTVDPRGISDPMQDAVKISGPDAPAGGLLGAWRNGQNFLRNVAELTGGQAIVGTNNVATAFTRIVEESTNYYVLGYYSSLSPKPNATRRVSVKAKSPEYRVRSRLVGNSWAVVGDSKGTPDDLTNAISGPVSDGGMPMRFLATALIGKSGGRVRLVLELKPGRQASRSDGTTEIDVLYQVIGAAGKLVTHKSERLQIANGGPPAEDGESWLHYVTEFDVKAGHYQLRLVAKTLADGTIGSVFGDVEVPDFSKSTPVITGIMFGAQPQGRWLAAASEDSLRDRLTLPSIVRPDFDRGQRATAFVQISKCAPVGDLCRISITVQSEAGTPVFQQMRELPSDALGAAGGLSQELPVSELQPGTYLLQFEAVAANKMSTRAVRRTVFAVR